MSCKVGAGIKKTFPVAVFTLALLCLAIAGTQLVNLGRANPYYYAGEVPPKPDTIPPKISLFSPENNTVYSTNDVPLAFNVSAPSGPTVHSPYVAEIYYKTDWQQNNVTVYEYSGYPANAYTEFSSEVWRSFRPQSNKLNVTGIPEGNHNITVFAWYRGWYVPGNDPTTLSENSFSIRSSSVVSFTVDTTPPSVSALSLENKTYDTSDVPLNFVLNESVSQISYVLDGQENVTISGNTTLTGLTDGPHNLTVYAKDSAGNTGASATIYFSVKIPFPTAIVATTSAATAAIIGAGLLVYFKKRNQS